MSSVASWSRDENVLIVHAYFDMLIAEMQGSTYNKAESRRNLIPNLNNRSHGAIERKHQNISAILIELGLPYISGYKPLSNYQRDVLPKVVIEWLGSKPGFLTLVRDFATAAPVVPAVDSILAALTERPKEDRQLKEEGAQYSFLPRQGVDYVSLELANQALGKAGELFVVNFERARLIYEERPDLADRVEHVAATRGDGLGYDVLSFETSSQERPIEVKTTKAGKHTPFYASSPEVYYSDICSNFHLYRVFEFSRCPRLYIVSGSLRQNFDLTPTNYMARIG